MAEMARIRETNAYHYASEIIFDDALQGVDWKCFGCEAHMTAVAADGLIDYVRSPHFRLLPQQQHYPGCEGEGFRTLGGTHARHDIGVPEQLILQGPPPPLAADENPGQIAVRNEGNVINNNEGQAAPGARVGSLHPIVQYYRENGADLNRYLKILDWPHNQYRFSFKNLRGEDDPIKLHNNRVFYAPIYHNRINIEDEQIIIPLFAPAQGEHYSVIFNLHHLTEHQRRVLSSTVRAFRDRQKDLVQNRRDETVILYFIGTRYQIDNAQFLIGDPRLCCFRVEPK